jgi:uncharacterized protein YceK
MKRMMFIVMLVPFLSGCGTFMARIQWREMAGMPRYYPATAFSGYCVAMPFLSAERSSKSWQELTLISVIGVVDLPISLMTDTIALPYDAFIYHDTLSRKEGGTIRDAHVREQEESNKTNGR